MKTESFVFKKADTKATRILTTARLVGLVSPKRKIPGKSFRKMDVIVVWLRIIERSCIATAGNRAQKLQEQSKWRNE